MNSVEPNPAPPLNPTQNIVTIFGHLRRFATAINQAAEGRLWGWTTKTAAAAIAPNEHIVLVAPTAPLTISIPDAKTMAGKRMVVKRTNNTTHTITVQAAAGNIDGAASVTLTTAYQSREMFSDGTNFWLV